MSSHTPELILFQLPNRLTAAALAALSAVAQAAANDSGRCIRPISPTSSVPWFSETVLSNGKNGDGDDFSTANSKNDIESNTIGDTPRPVKLVPSSPLNTYVTAASMHDLLRAYELKMKATATFDSAALMTQTIAAAGALSSQTEQCNGGARNGSNGHSNGAEGDQSTKLSPCVCARAS